MLKTDSSAVFKSKERIYAKNFSPLSFFFGGRFLRALWLEMLEIAITLRHCVFLPVHFDTADDVFFAVYEIKNVLF